MFKRILSMLLTVLMILGSTSINNIVSAEESVKKFIPISVYGESSLNYYETIVQDGEIFISATDICKITGSDIVTNTGKQILENFNSITWEYETLTFNDMSPFNEFTKVTIELWEDELHNGVVVETNRNQLLKKATARGTTHEIPVLNKNDTHYLPLEKMLVLLLCEWVVEDSVLYVLQPQEDILTFYSRKYDTINKYNSYKSDLYVNDDGKWATAIKNVLASLIEDFDPIIFIPGGVDKMIKEDYENALLMIANDDRQYFNNNTIQNIDKFLEDDLSKKSSYALSTAINIVNIPDNIAEGIDTSVEGVTEIWEWYTKRTANIETNKFFRNELGDIMPTQFKSLSKQLSNISKAITVIEIIENANEIANRSKQWNDDFIRQLKILSNINPYDYNDDYTKSAAQRLIDEYNDPSNTVTNAVIWDVLGALADELWGLTPAGKFTNVVSTGVNVAKDFLRLEELDNKIKARSVGYEINYLINVEIIARTERNSIYKEKFSELNNGVLEYSDIKLFRDSLMLSLRAALRNKAIVYYYSSTLENGWTQAQTDEMNNNLAEIYSLIIQLMETERFDILLSENNLNDYYYTSSKSEKFAREKIPQEIVFNENPLIVYSDVLTEYRKAQENDFYKDDLDINYGHKDFPKEINYEISMTTRLSYSLVKLDKSSFPILIFAEPHNSDFGYRIYDVYGYVNGRVQRLFDNDTMGNRSNYVVCQDGIIRCWGSDGAGHTTISFYRIDNSEGLPYEFLQLEFNGWSGDKYYIKRESNEQLEISSEEYNSTINSYPLQDNIQWFDLMHFGDERNVKLTSSDIKSNIISSGSDYTVVLKENGTVTAFGDNNYYGQCNVSDWRNIKAVSAGFNHTVGLKKDGTVIATGDNSGGKCDISDWNEIISICAGYHHTVGLKTDGTVIAVGDNYYGQCNVSGWSNIVAVSAGYGHTVGLKKDGTVIATGAISFGDTAEELINVADWNNVISISSGDDHIVGLKKDGTVIATGNNYYGQCNVSNWQDIVSVSAGSELTAGIKSDGSVITVGGYEDFEAIEPYSRSNRRNVIAISCRYDSIVGVTIDGNIFSCHQRYFQSPNYGE